jgi:hypothetical protein
MSAARRRGLVRLAILIVVVGWLAVLGINAGFSGGSGTQSSSVASVAKQSPPPHLVAKVASVRLPKPLHGLTAVTTADGLLIIGGADSSDVSTDQVLLLDPHADSTGPFGTLTEPLHDAAAANLGSRLLVFGGGAAATLDTVQELVRDGSAMPIGHLPAKVSDLSAIPVGGAVYILGGYDGQSPVDSVLRTTDGSTLKAVATLPTAVRYTAVATLDNRIYAFGGELGTGADSNEIQEYDVASGRTRIAGRLTQPVSHASVVVLNGFIYLLGGRRNGAASDQILRFDPARGTAVPAGRLPSPVFDGAAATASGVGYLVGGVGAQGVSVDSVVKLSENP